MSDDIPAGLVTLPLGWWHRSSPDDRGVNVLTDAATGADDTGSAAFHEALVEVTRVPAHAGG